MRRTSWPSDHLARRVVTLVRESLDPSESRGSYTSNPGRHPHHQARRRSAADDGAAAASHCARHLRPMRVLETLRPGRHFLSSSTAKPCRDGIEPWASWVSAFLTDLPHQRCPVRPGPRRKRHRMNEGHQPRRSSPIGSRPTGALRPSDRSYHAGTRRHRNRSQYAHPRVHASQTRRSVRCGCHRSVPALLVASRELDRMASCHVHRRRWPKSDTTARIVGLRRAKGPAHSDLRPYSAAILTGGAGCGDRSIRSNSSQRFLAPSTLACLTWPKPFMRSGIVASSTQVA
jgi:hypothetical protein